MEPLQRRRGRKEDSDDDDDDDGKENKGLRGHTYIHVLTYLYTRYDHGIWFDGIHAKTRVT